MTTIGKPPGGPPPVGNHLSAGVSVPTVKAGASSPIRAMLAGYEPFTPSPVTAGLLEGLSLKNTGPRSIARDPGNQLPQTLALLAEHSVRTQK